MRLRITVGFLYLVFIYGVIIARTKSFEYGLQYLEILDSRGWLKIIHPWTI